MARVPVDPAAWLAEIAAAAEVPNELLEHIGARLDRGDTPATLATRLQVLRLVDGQLRPYGVGLLAAPETVVRAWWRRLRNDGLAEATRAQRLSLVRGFYRWAIREELRPDDPTWRLDGPRLEPRLPRPAPEREVRQLLTATAGREAWVPVALAVLCGLRCAEIAGARVEQLQRDNAGRWTLLVRGKGKHERRVNVPDELVLLTYNGGRPGPLVRGRAGEHYTPDGISHLLARTLRRFGINATAHQLRHLYATRTYQLTGDLLTTQRALGHRNPSATAIYAQADPAALRETAEHVWAELTAPTPAGS